MIGTEHFIQLLCLFAQYLNQGKLNCQNLQAFQLEQHLILLGLGQTQFLDEFLTPRCNPGTRNEELNGVANSDLSAGYHAAWVP